MLRKMRREKQEPAEREETGNNKSRLSRKQAGAGKNRQEG